MVTVVTTGLSCCCNGKDTDQCEAHSFMSVFICLYNKNYNSEDTCLV